MNSELIAYLNDSQIDHFAGEIGLVYINQYSPEKLTYASDLERQIEEAWRILEEDAKKKNLPLRNGEILRFQDYHITFNNNGKIAVGLNVVLTDYKHIRIGREIQSPKKVFAISTSSLCYFKDPEDGEKNYIFGQKNNGAELWQSLPAGYFDCSLLPANIQKNTGLQTNTLFTLNILKEFGEEVGIAVEKIKAVELLGIYVIGDYQREKTQKVIHYNDLVINYAIEIAATGQEVTNSLQRKIIEQREHKDFAVVKESELYNFFQDHALVPHTKAVFYPFFCRERDLL